ncbi:AbrB/MazE/SpoVT family DNA-binding domain-containing protein [Nostoc sp. FACHB-152]|uniref:AbrB/MazE/SpoVT family DNA-binding domain-containing protein n=1 Tax=unclassified Nostoc TaxID=2593658 RepID=UPI001688E9E7|nr:MULTISPECIES: AbrB/MazE/SpoVT family DNA-binding domain-containing protein [unclassified Nostoc]MBD2448827.1 AbrB/MazE/SpoVT family DNA-binding domain-containing protein [Nostoc sp. FACHB-152]MBD2469842.1 AbrB/MazE/SpoVT family DNA-binding domain-containing protein [Nostoc sp. FACHB-145]
MEITKISSEGQVIIPEELLKASGWEVGQELIAINMGDGILLKPKKPFAEITLNDVAGCLKYQGLPKSLEDMNDAIRQGVEESWYGGN